MTTMRMLFAYIIVLELAAAHQTTFSSAEEPWTVKYGPQIDLPFTGPLTFSHLPQHKCLDDSSILFDIAVLGMPFDTAVSYRPGARFGPYAIRSGSRRQRRTRGYTLSWSMNPYDQGQTIIDCGDVPISPFDNAVAIDQMETAYDTLLARPVANNSAAASVTALAKDQQSHPRIVTLGGDHTLVALLSGPSMPVSLSHLMTGSPSPAFSLQGLRSHNMYRVIHFDAHLDTWNGAGYPGSVGTQAQINHGTFFYIAQTEGLLTNSSVHAGIRCKLEDGDTDHDASIGFQLYSTDDLDDLGAPTIIRHIRERVGLGPVYLSLDIDVIDPGMAPATGTPEAAGWTTREVKRLIRGLAGLNIVGADIVEVAPAYDHAEITGIAAADIVHDFLSLLTVRSEPQTKVHARKSEL